MTTSLSTDGDRSRGEPQRIPVLAAVRNVLSCICNLRSSWQQQQSRSPEPYDVGSSVQSSTYVCSVATARKDRQSAQFEPRSPGD